jgi:hypothetical protein
MDILKSNIIVGVSAALAVTVLAPVLVPVMATAGRPLAKSLLKGGLMLYEKSREALAMAGEAVEDMLAEIHAEEAMRAAAAEQAAEEAAAAPADVAAPAPATKPAPAPAATTEPPRPAAGGAAAVANGGNGTRAPQAGVAAL